MLRASFAYNDWQQQVGPAPSSIRTTCREVRTRVARSSRRWATSSAPSSSTRSGSSMSAEWSSSRWVSRAAANLFGRQGYPIVYFVQAFTGDAADSAPLLQIGQVGAYRLPDVFVLDLHVEKPFQIGSAVTISPDARLLQRGEQPHRASARRVRRVVRRYDSARTPSRRQLQQSRRVPQQPRLPRRCPDRVLAGPIALDPSERTLSGWREGVPCLTAFAPLGSGQRNLAHNRRRST